MTEEIAKAIAKVNGWAAIADRKAKDGDIVGAIEARVSMAAAARKLAEIAA